MPVFALKFISGKYQGGEIPIPDEGEMIIGRASDLDLVLVEDMVSRKHAKMVSEDGTLSITDLGSTNGTFVNGEKIKRADLKRNDRILIGTSIIKVIPGADMSMDVGTDKDSQREMLEKIANRAPQSSTMSGDLEEVPLPDLLQLFATNKKSGILTITGPAGQPQRSGKVYIRNGQLVFATAGSDNAMRPMKVICRMVGWESGAFHLEEWDGEHTFTDTFDQSTESVLMEALRQHDELRRLLPHMPKPNASLTLCVPMVPKLSDLSGPELDTLQMVLNFNTLKHVIDKVDATDFEATQSLQKLLTEGYLEVDFD